MKGHIVPVRAASYGPEVGPDEMSVLKFLLALLKKGNMMAKEEGDQEEGGNEA